MFSPFRAAVPPAPTELTNLCQRRKQLPGDERLLLSFLIFFFSLYFSYSHFHCFCHCLFLSFFTRHLMKALFLFHELSLPLSPYAIWTNHKINIHDKANQARKFWHMFSVLREQCKPQVAIKDASL